MNNNQKSTTPFLKQKPSYRSPYQVKLSRISLGQTKNFISTPKTPLKINNSFQLTNFNTDNESQLINNQFGGFFLPATTRRAKFFSCHSSETESDLVQLRATKMQLSCKRKLHFGEKSMSQLIPIKVTIYFTLDRLQKRLLHLIKTNQEINSRVIRKYINDLPIQTIEQISLHCVNYKKQIALECFSLILKFMIFMQMAIGNQLKLEKLLIYVHQSNNLQAAQQLQIKTNSFTTYIHQFYQYQLMNPTIPSSNEKLNKYFEQQIEKIVKQISNVSIKSDSLKLYESILQKNIPLQQQVDIMLNILSQIDKDLVLLPQNDEVYTLVLDLDETLVHLVETSGDHFKILVRPYTLEFLSVMSQYYEIVIFTAGLRSYADKIINYLDQFNHCISHRLYREHTYIEGDKIIKDLSLLGRPLNKTLIIDNNETNYQLQPENGIKIKTWTGEENDKALKDLMPYLQQLSEYKDVRIGVKSIKHNSQYFSTT